jgi:hypothetical protein
MHGDFLLRTLKQPKPLDESIVSNAPSIYTDTVAFNFFSLSFSMTSLC